MGAQALRKKFRCFDRFKTSCLSKNWICIPNTNINS